MYDRLFDYEFDEALDALTCEEEFDDRFDDYADEGEVVNREPYDDDWTPMSDDEFMRMVL